MKMSAIKSTREQLVELGTSCAAGGVAMVRELRRIQELERIRRSPADVVSVSDIEPEGFPSVDSEDLKKFRICCVAVAAREVFRAIELERGLVSEQSSEETTRTLTDALGILVSQAAVLRFFGQIVFPESVDADLFVAGEIIDILGQGTALQAVSFVKEHHADIQRVAAELRVHRVLDSCEIDCIVRAADDDLIQYRAMRAARGGDPENFVA
jgi:hypothetical protein